MGVTRRSFVGGLVAAGLVPVPGLARATAADKAAQDATQIFWTDLLPPGVARPKIIGEGFRDEERDIWKPEYDANATLFNDAVIGQYVSLPGFVIPLDGEEAGITSFILSPQPALCVHTPPPPANQLVYVRLETPWRPERLFLPMWVTGELRREATSLDIAELGYAMQGHAVTPYR